MSYDAAKVFGAGVTSVQKDVPPDTLEIPAEVHKGPKGSMLTFEIRRLPTLEASDIIGRINRAEQSPGDAEDKLANLMEACKLLTDERGKKGKKKPAVICGMSGLTLAIFEGAVNDHQRYEGEVFDKMRENSALEFPPDPNIIRYVLSQNALIRLMVIGKMGERVEEVKAIDEGNALGSGSGSE